MLPLPDVAILLERKPAGTQRGNKVDLTSRNNVDSTLIQCFDVESMLKTLNVDSTF